MRYINTRLLLLLHKTMK